ncbi:hypothetical protein [Vibrio alginolyticus]|uniref:hypothetical protein n=1 Tax=Vibrio alginolyticus TaxID=663 RepID=UPI0006CA7AB0|nr:hypothetical protein [Vibrio alginolyticus]KPM97444.1 hypothetical protein AOG25_13280 [Vibrio alginolyticus]CAH7182863.1 conserved hypothetical protein [Vibrio chagasii]CAH7352025.1 conserved hypothetical protein [Vibrio chagasii]
MNSFPRKGFTLPEYIAVIALSLIGLSSVWSFFEYRNDTQLAMKELFKSEVVLNNVLNSHPTRSLVKPRYQHIGTASEAHRNSELAKGFDALSIEEIDTAISLSHENMVDLAMKKVEAQTTETTFSLSKHFKKKRSCQTYINNARFDHWTSVKTRLGDETYPSQPSKLNALCSDKLQKVTLSYCIPTSLNAC